MKVRNKRLPDNVLTLGSVMLRGGCLYLLKCCVPSERVDPVLNPKPQT